MLNERKEELRMMEAKVCTEEACRKGGRGVDVGDA